MSWNTTALRRNAIAIASALVMPAAASAQDAPKVVTPALDFSGVILMNYKNASDSASKAPNGGQSASKFDIERVYLNFRMPAGEDGTIRVTTDVFNGDQSSTSYYKGWTARLKYAYFQYAMLHDIGDMKGFNASVRLGMSQTSVIDFEEQFWTRWVSQTSVERNGMFSSSDVGVAGIVTLPGKWGEVYGMVSNGPGYAQAEADPYKDVQMRVSLTPFGKDDGILKTFTIAPWIYQGSTASKFIAGGTGQVGPVTDGLKRNRSGVFVGLRDRRLTFGLDYANRTETTESGANTTASPRVATDNTGTLTAAFLMMRPIELFGDDPKAKSPLNLFARVDNFKPYNNATIAGAQTTSAATQILITGISWDLNSKTTFSLDMQNLTRSGGSTAVEQKVLFLHGVINF